MTGNKIYSISLLNYILWVFFFLHTAVQIIEIEANPLPIVDKGVFVITGVQTCRQGSGYCVLGGDCSVDKEFASDDLGGHCDGLRKAFTPRAYFVCCKYNNNETAGVVLGTTTTTTTMRTTTTPASNVTSDESKESTEDSKSKESVESVEDETSAKDKGTEGQGGQTLLIHPVHPSAGPLFIAVPGNQVRNDIPEVKPTLVSPVHTEIRTEVSVGVDQHVSLVHLTGENKEKFKLEDLNQPQKYPTSLSQTNLTQHDIHTLFRSTCGSNYHNQANTNNGNFNTFYLNHNNDVLRRADSVRGKNNYNHGTRSRISNEGHRPGSAGTSNGNCWTGAIVRNPSTLSFSSNPSNDPGSFLCTGALIEPLILITTATCVSRLFSTSSTTSTGSASSGLNMYRVALGTDNLIHPSNGVTSDAIYFQITQVVIHENYHVLNNGDGIFAFNNNLRINDVALVKLSLPPEEQEKMMNVDAAARFNRICTICLPEENPVTFNSETEESCIVTGYSHPAGNPNHADNRENPNFGAMGGHPHHHQFTNENGAVETDGILHVAEQRIYESCHVPSMVIPSASTNHDRSTSHRDNSNTNPHYLTHFYSNSRVSDNQPGWRRRPPVPMDNDSSNPNGNNFSPFGMRDNYRAGLVQNDEVNSATNAGLLCAGGKFGAEVCFSPRDAGSPLACTSQQSHDPKFFLRGVFSSGFHCGSIDSPVMFTDIRKHLKWIRRNLNSAVLDLPITRGE